MLFSIRFFSNLSLPFFLNALVGRIGLRKSYLALVMLCCLGQFLFTLGLSTHNYNLCLIGRFVFGLSDSMTVFQHTILCLWFDANILPLVFGVLLFLVKLVRATNDNVASMFFNTTGSLTGYFWVGQVVCLASLVSAYYLISIHEAVVEPPHNIKD